ncbi:MAG: response regulator [Desulfuromonadales bacterium]|nr:response regulator [Desulfuromonadales bacterium]
MTKKTTILVVDDSPTQLAVLEDALLGCGYRVETAANGEEAIGQIYESPPDIVLSDVLMPELNGYHLCRLLKNDPVTADIPVILLTNLSEQHDRFWGENAGADLYLEKGSDLPKICSQVQKVLDTTPRSLAAHSSSSSLRPAFPGGVDAQSRVTGILDRLLYDSTISNEILKLTSHVHDLDLLATEYFRFLGAISRYVASGLLIDLGHDRMALCLQVPESFSTARIAAVEKKGLASLDLSNQTDSHMETIVIEAGETPRASEDLDLLFSRPIFENDRFLGGIFLIGQGNQTLTEGTAHSLDVVAERLGIVVQYLKKVREIETFKADFISMMVHDLRSPLTSIKGFADLLHNGTLGEISKEQAGAVGNIQDGCVKLLDLIEDILDLSKLEAGKMEIYPGPTPLQGVIADVSNGMDALLAEKKLALKVNIDETIPLADIDAKQMSRVFYNLLSNALKFTYPGGEITVDAYPMEGGQQSESGIRVDITDTGTGIPPEKQRLIFTRYQQLTSQENEQRVGTGLGLAICREIVQLHGGRIWVKSPVENGAGSRFSLILPAV